MIKALRARMRQGHRTVAYPAGHPDKAYIRTFRQMYFGSLLMLLFASPFLALAVWGTIMQVRDRLRAKPPAP